MSFHVSKQISRTARVNHKGRDGLTVAHVREFLADCEAAGIPDDARVSVEDKLAHEGGNRSGWIEASHREIRPQQHDVPQADKSPA